LEQVQADEIKAKTQFGTLWMAFAIWVPTRLWMGGVVSPKRDLDLIQSLADKVRQMALCRPLLLAVDGLASLFLQIGNNTLKIYPFGFLPIRSFCNHGNTNGGFPMESQLTLIRLKTN
jgi:hypothetical protein